MRYANHVAGDDTFKSHAPRLHYSANNGGWKEERSGLALMKAEREAEVWREIAETMRRKGA